MESKYSVQQLLAMRDLARNVELEFDPANYEVECVPEPAAQKPQHPVVEEVDVIRFRKNPVGGNEVKFHMDKDVPVNQIVHVYNLAQSVEWPHLTTFCKKTIGIKPFDIRMMRRAQPAEARIIFHSAAEAKEFLSKITPETKVKGKVAKFVIETCAPRGSSTNGSKSRNLGDASENMETEAATRPANISAAIPAAVLWDGKKKARKHSEHTSAEFVEGSVAQLAEDDDCCGKAKNTPTAGVVAAAVVVDDKLGGKQPTRAIPTMAAASKKPVQGRRGASAGGRGKGRNGAASVTGICVEHMPVDMDVY